MTGSLASGRAGGIGLEAALLRAAIHLWMDAQRGRGH
jgi:hypothetical protein